jgi:hypothetical protein
MWKGPCEIGLKWIVLESWKTLCRISPLKVQYNLVIENKNGEKLTYFVEALA